VPVGDAKNGIFDAWNQRRVRRVLARKDELPEARAQGAAPMIIMSWIGT